MTSPEPLTIEERIARIERVLQDVADGTVPWKAARDELGSMYIAPDAVIPMLMSDPGNYTITVHAPTEVIP